MNRALVVLAGLSGAAGVALSAIAAHAGGSNLDTAARFLLVHAAALLAIGLARPAGRALTLAACGLALGTALFCGDLVARDLLGTRLFPMAAPAGGVLLIAGWLGVAAAAAGAWRKGGEG